MSDPKNWTRLPNTDARFDENSPARRERKIEVNAHPEWTQEHKIPTEESMRRAREHGFHPSEAPRASRRQSPHMDVQEYRYSDLQPTNTPEKKKKVAGWSDANDGHKKQNPISSARALVYVMGAATLAILTGPAFSILGAKKENEKSPSTPGTVATPPANNQPARTNSVPAK